MAKPWNSNLERRTPLRSKSSLSRSSRLKRGRGPGRNDERRERRRERDFGKKSVWVSRLPCVVCRYTPCDPHHEPPRSVGGTKKDLVPLCHKHHVERHQTGVESFQEKHDLDLTEEAKRTEAAWQERSGE